MAERPRRMRDIREERGWSARELARRAGVGANTVLGAEDGSRRPRKSTWFKLADALGVYSPLDLLEYREQHGYDPDRAMFMLRSDKVREGNLEDLREAMDRLEEDDVRREFERYLTRQRGARFRRKQKE